MAATSIGVQFDIVDLDASYEVVGTSDNYSFQYDLGRGSDLVNFEGESFQKVISLKGNYGNFEIRVFAVSDIGIRSEFIQDEISISAPEFDNTFTFSNLRVEDTESNLSLDSYNVYSPKEQGDKLIVNSEFLNKKINLKWELIPPGGHAKEGKSLSRELFGDTFLDHFEIRIRRGEGGTLVTESEINNSLSLAASLNASTPYDLLTNYKSFEIEINQAAFDELNLERTNSFEIVSYDSFGRTATGLLTGVNYYPSLDNFIYDLNSSSLSMSWSSVDKDVSSVHLSGIAIPSSEQLYAVDNIADNVEYYSSLNDAPIWTSINNKIYKLGDKVLYTDDYVYECILEHTASLNSNPTSQSHWRQLNKKIDYFYFERQPNQNNFQIKQIFGYSYYYGIQASDGFGTGINYNITQDGLSDGGELRGFASSISLKNLRYRERGEDLIFNWDVVDQDDNAVDISQNKFIFTESDVPSLLGISGSLYDLKTNQYLTGITQGNNSSSAILDPALNKVKIDGLHNAGVFYAYEYTRAINNSIYGVGGFPANIVDYDSSVTYNLSSTPNSVIAGGDQLFEIKNDNSIISPNIAPYYDDWSSSVTYDQNDVVKYNSVLYVVDAKFGIESDDIVEFFNENNSYTAGQLVVFVDQTVPVFNPEAGYFEHNLVLYNGEIYKSLQDQNEGSAAIPGQDANSWKVATILVDYGAAIYKCLNNVFPPASVSPIQDVDNWQIQNPSSSDHFSVYVQAYSDEVQYSIGDLVFYDDIVYVAQTININSLPVTAETNATYVDWLPIWERNTSYDDIIFQHIGIPEGGKRSIGIEIGILDNNGEIIESKRLDADNPPPVISSAGFSEKIDTTSEVTKVKFNFNYLLDHQEKTSRVNVYRIPEHEVEQYDAGGNVVGYDFGKFVITGEDGSPDTSEYLVQTILGSSNDTYGDNINKIIDEPPIPFNENGVDQITGYYYKILPFDDFGSGELYTVPNGDPLTSVEDKIVVYPKRFNDNNPYSAPGKVVRPDSTSDNIPGPVKNFNGSVAFENFFLNWTAPNQDYDPDVPNKLLDWTENDIDHYEVWASSNSTIQTGVIDSNGNVVGSEVWLPVQNTGYRKIEGVLYSVGEKPKEIKDPARNIVYAENIFNVPANAPSIEVVHKGETNVQQYFWVRAVDLAGNKSPFTGSSDDYIDGIKGLSLIPGTIAATDVGDFESSMTDKFGNSIALVPSDPFSSNSPSNGNISWSNHVLYYQGNGYFINEGNTNSGYVWWDKSELPNALPNNGKYEYGSLENIYYSGNYKVSDAHPQGGYDSSKKYIEPSTEFSDDDFIIARNNNGISSPAHYSFPNALIGTANIAEAAIIDAKIKDLSADKITAGQIKGHRLEIINSGSDQSTYGSLASKGFSGIRNENISGFVLSGDGSFAFQQGGSSLTFDDEGLVLRGKLQQKNGLDFDFIDINATPAYFNYIENQDETFDLLDSSQQSSIEVYFRNSSITDTSDIQIKIEKFNGSSSSTVIEYTDADSEDLDVYLESRILSNQTLNTSISASQYDGIIGDTHESIVLYFKNKNSNIERNITIARIVDGKAGVDAKTVSLTASESAISYDSSDSLISPTSITLSADAQNFDSAHFTFSGAISQSGNSNTAIFVCPASYSSAPYTFTVEVREGSAGNVIATDKITIVSIKPGLDGEDAYTVILTNETHTLPADNAGNVTSYSGSGTSIIVYKGLTELNGITSGTPGVQQFTVQASGEGITADSSPTNSDSPLVYGDASAMSADNAKITFTINIENSVEFTKIQTFSKSKQGAVGDSVNLEFQKADSSGALSDTGWEDEPQAAGSGFLWARKLVNGIQQGSPFRVDADAIAEVYVYTNSDISNNNDKPSSDTVFDFSSNGLNISASDSNWSSSPDSLVNNGDVVSVLVGVASGYKGQTDASISWIVPGAIFSQRTDGAPGNLGSSPSFRGVWNSTTEYIGEISTSPTTPARGDVVYHNTQYYICKDTASGSSQSPTNNSYWQHFGGQFSSVATELLLTKDAFISEKLTLGIDSNSLLEPHSGIIVSAGFTGGIYDVQNLPYRDIELNGVYEKKYNSPWYDVDFNYSQDYIYIGNNRLDQNRLDQWNDNTIQINQAEYDSLPPIHDIRRRGGYIGDLGKNQFEKKHQYETPGFLLARIDDNRAIFDVGGTGQLGNDSYIRFDSSKGKIEIAGTFINNTILAPDFDVNSLQFSEDPFGAFVGGGYNNFISIDEVGDFNSLGSAITAGAWNIMQSRFSFIGAGYSGDCRDNFSAIVAGYGNSIPLEEAGNHQGANFIGCGIENMISGGTSQTIVNGSNNEISQTGRGSYIPISDVKQGWLAPGFFGQINGNFVNDFIPANFSSTTAAGWVENSWWPASGIQDWGSYNFSEGFWLGGARGVDEGSWVFHLDIGWTFVSSSSNELYKKAFLQLYPISKHQCPILNGFWMWLADFNDTYRGWWWFSRSNTINVTSKYILIYNDNIESYHLRNNSGTLQIKLETSSSWNNAK